MTIIFFARVLFVTWSEHHHRRRSYNLYIPRGGSTRRRSIVFPGPTLDYRADDPCTIFLFRSEVVAHRQSIAAGTYHRLWVPIFFFFFFLLQILFHNNMLGAYYYYYRYVVFNILRVTQIESKDPTTKSISIYNRYFRTLSKRFPSWKYKFQINLLVSTAVYNILYIRSTNWTGWERFSMKNSLWHLFHIFILLTIVLEIRNKRQTI